MKFTRIHLAMGLALWSFAALNFAGGCGRVRERSRYVSPAMAQRSQEETDLFNQALAAWHGEHDYAKAEALIRKLDTLENQPKGSSLHSDILAGMADEQGHEEEAFAYYRKTMRDPNTVGQRNAKVLFRYGQLAEKFHQPQEAAGAYAAAIEFARNSWHPAKPVLPQSPSNLTVLRNQAAQAAGGPLKLSKGQEKGPG